MEYLGEIIDENEKNDRKKMGMGGYFFGFPSQVNLFIDARKKGNFCRFINHSCNPNCHIIEVIICLILFLNP